MCIRDRDCAARGREGRIALPASTFSYDVAQADSWWVGSALSVGASARSGLVSWASGAAQRRCRFRGFEPALAGFAIFAEVACVVVA
eukprot:3995716-Heterocapsa_arctica.AAC.1